MEAGGPPSLAPCAQTQSRLILPIGADCSEEDQGQGLAERVPVGTAPQVPPLTVILRGFTIVRREDGAYLLAPVAGLAGVPSGLLVTGRFRGSASSAARRARQR